MAHIHGHEILQYSVNPTPNPNTNTNPHSPYCVMRFIVKYMFVCHYVNFLALIAGACNVHLHIQACVGALLKVKIDYQPTIAPLKLSSVNRWTGEVLCTDRVLAVDPD